VGRLKMHDLKMTDWKMTDKLLTNPEVQAYAQSNSGNSDDLE